jgi:hypothetical protein
MTYRPVIAFVRRISASGGLVNMTKTTRIWKMWGMSNTMDWVVITITDSKDNTLFFGNMDFGTKVLVVQKAQKKMSDVIVTAFRKLYPDLKVEYVTKKSVLA